MIDDMNRVTLCVDVRDGNLGTDTRPDGYEYGDNFLPTGGTRTQPELRRVWDGYFFSIHG
jgi:hypothetical protein